MQVEVRGEDGRPLAAGEIGEVWMKGDVVMLGYHHLPEQSRERLREGWVSMGDLGYFDARRYLYLVDRKNFMIISGGYNVYPVVVENVLSQHPAVREVAVVGVPHPEWGEAVVAAVSLVPGGQASEEEVIAFCRGRVGLWEVPKAVLVLEDLPKGSTGKIQKKQIQQQLAEPSVRLPWRIKG
jgi:acyl-CoA synthetase (AMP-forming)/AMP-acid ligase II